MYGFTRFWRNVPCMGHWRPTNGTNRRARLMLAVAVLGQNKAGRTTLPILPVCQCQNAAVGFRDLPGEHQSNTRPLWLGREEWHEQVFGPRNAWTLIEHRNFEMRTEVFPGYADPAARFRR